MLRDEFCRVGRRWAWAGIVMLSLAVSQSGCNSGKADAAPQGRPAPLVSLAPAMKKPMPRVITTFGQARSKESVSVRAQVTEVLREVHFAKGQTIAYGQPLFTIESQSYETALMRAMANLERAQANLERAKSNLERARSNLDGAQANLERDKATLKLQVDTLAKIQELFTSGYAKQNEVDNAQAAVDSAAAVVRADEAAIRTADADINTAEAEISTAEADIRVAKADIAKADLDLAYCVITSPLDGVAGDIKMTPGNIVKANDTELVVINQITPIEVTFALPESQLATVQKYHAAGELIVHAQARGGQPHEGQLTFIDNQVDTATGTVQMAATFENKDDSLWPGQFADVTLTLAVDNDAIVVPSRALQTGRNGKFVFVARDNVVMSRPVTVVQAAGPDTVVQGVAAGEMIVTEGQMSLTDGTAFRLREGASR